jgi:hypothetical protein
LGRSEHRIAATQSPSRVSAKVITSRTIPASAGPVPRSPPKNATAAPWKSCKPQLVNRIDPA